MPTATRILIAALCCALAAGAAHAQPPESPRTRTVERLVHLDAPGPGASRYAYVPFDVPRGAVRVAVRYGYAREGGANTIDLGVFDARSSGSDADPRGFRGWSGGRRSEFFITRAEATPGYLPGELPAGTWRIILGLYKVAPAGVDVTFKIEIETGEVVRGAKPSAPRRAEHSSAGPPKAPGSTAGTRTPPPDVRQAAGRNLRWWRGDLHMHTVHSDGDWTVHGLAEAARDAGLDFIFVTDHNTSSHHAEVESAGLARRSPLVMRGEEITTYGGHTNAWGLPAGAWVDFRVRPGDSARISSVAARAHRYGALVSVNHPFALCGGCDWSYRDVLGDFDAVEVWNGDWDSTDERALKMWDEALRRGLRLTAIASSDSHRPQSPIGRPTTHVAAAALSQAALLAAIRGGRVYLTGEAPGLAVDFEVGAGRLGSRSAVTARRIAGEEIRLRAPGALVFFVRVAPLNLNPHAPGPVPRGANVSLVSNGRTIHTWGANEMTEVFEVECRGDAYYRLEVRGRAGAMLALTNPIYVRVGAKR